MGITQAEFNKIVGNSVIETTCYWVAGFLVGHGVKYFGKDILSSKIRNPNPVAIAHWLALTCLIDGLFKIILRTFDAEKKLNSFTVRLFATLSTYYLITRKYTITKTQAALCAVFALAFNMVKNPEVV